MKKTLVVIGILALALTACGKDKKDSTTSTSSAGEKVATPTTAKKVDAVAFTCPNADGTSAHIVFFETGVAKNCLEEGKAYVATFDTSEGKIVVDLDRDASEAGVNNFVALSRYHYFDGTKIFRTDPSIGILQSGSPHTQDATDPGSGLAVKDTEKSYTYKTGDLVYARSYSPDSSSSQYFVCAKAGCENLDSQGNYITFGHISSGLDVAAKILDLHRADNSGLGGAPSRTVVVKSVTISEK